MADEFKILNIIEHEDESVDIELKLSGSFLQSVIEVGFNTILKNTIEARNQDTNTIHND